MREEMTHVVPGHGYEAQISERLRHGATLRARRKATDRPAGAHEDLQRSAHTEQRLPQPTCTANAS